MTDLFESMQEHHAERDQRFRRCIAQMVEDGICTAEGVLLRAYRDNQFVSVD